MIIILLFYKGTSALTKEQLLFLKFINLVEVVSVSEILKASICIPHEFLITVLVHVLNNYDNHLQWKW
jgi:hypothetical protein